MVRMKTMSSETTIIMKKTIIMSTKTIIMKKSAEKIIMKKKMPAEKIIMMKKKIPARPCLALDSHVQDLLLQETSNDRAATRERAKLSQMEKDGMTPIFPGCRPQDMRLHVTLDYLQMKTQNKWTDSSFSKNLKFWHDRLPEGNTLPSSTEEAKKVVCPLDLPSATDSTAGSSKTVYLGARRWLRLDHPWRKRGDLFDGKDEPDGPPRPRSGAEIDDLLKNRKECPAPGKMRPKPESLLGVWKARKSKDGPKARYDLKHFGIRKDLQAPDTDDDQTEGTQRLRKRAKMNAVRFPPPLHNDSEELEQFFSAPRSEVPHGYSGI
ncbi:hypothetical protein QYE76_034508 [Lolium multiflorum]|uniref:Uncharacterized protein n=1 Tax=Lolium multiflorum TaxID=4521 RepID=A0AAD8VN56_LOLMU|nr:hypothetical protein QYE76_034508 [Lolium multiflorum]